MQAVVYTDDLYLYALVHQGLAQAGWQVLWKQGSGLALAGLDQMEKGEVLLWTTPWGLRGYDPLGMVFLTRRDDPKTLALGLKGQVGLRLLPGERAVLLAAGSGVPLKLGALVQALGFPRDRVRFFLKGLKNKFALGEGELVRLARHQVQVMGLKGHAKPLAGAKAKPFLHVPRQEEAQGQRPQEAPPVRQAFGVQAL